MTELQPGVAARYAALEQALAKALAASNRPPRAVTLLAVGKTFDERALEAVADLGQRAFGENYAQEGCAKVDWFKGHRPDLKLEWHFIGPLQANKTRMVAERFDWVETVDRLRIAERLSAQRPAGMAPINILLEVNIDGEATKSGVAPDALDALIDEVAKLPNVVIRGLMAIPAPADSPEKRLAPLRAMRALFDDIRLRRTELPLFDTLSMGMSADLAEAVEAGSTQVRVGSAIFGARAYPPARGAAAPDFEQKEDIHG